MTIHLHLPHKGETGTIHVRTFKRGQEYVATTKQKIQRKHWNKKKQTVLPNSAELVRLKERLERLVEDLENFMIEPRTTTQFQERVYRFMNADGNSFKIAFDEFVTFKEVTLAGSSSSKYRALSNHLEDFSETFDIEPDFPIINEDFAAMFYAYCSDTGLSPNYGGRLIKALRTFMIWSKEKSYHAQESWRKMKARKVKMPVTFMYGDEIVHFLNYPLVGSLADARDCFLVGCGTGLRASDQARIRPGHNQIEGLAMSTTKDQDEVIIQIPDWCREILNRHNWQLPVFSNYEYNKHLKAAAKAAGLDRPIRVVQFKNFKKVDVHEPLHKVIGPHMGRRVYVTAMLALGYPEAQIIQWTGHSSGDALKPYRGLINEEIKRQYREAWAA